MNGQLVTEVRITWVLFALLIVLSLTATASEAKEETAADEQGNKIALNPKIYSHVLVRKREEHKLFVKHLLNSNYEKSYKLLDIAFGKIFQLFQELNATFIQSGYSPKSGFPSDDKLIDPVTLLIENTCLAGEVVLHMPEISYRIFQKYREWKEHFGWSLNFVAEFRNVLNDETATMLESFRAEINNSSSRKYATKDLPTTKPPETKTKKKKKRIKKGPQLVARNEL